MLRKNAFYTAYLVYNIFVRKNAEELRVVASIKIPVYHRVFQKIVFHI